MAKQATLKQFQASFPTDDVCLEHLFVTRYGDDVACPKCGEIGSFHRLTGQPAYTCNCGHHIHPMAGTPFQDTRTPLTTWFHVMFLFCSSRNGVSAKEVQQVISELPAASSTVFRLFVYEGYTHRQIATQLNISQGTSKWLVSEAKKLLKKKFVGKYEKKFTENATN